MALFRLYFLAAMLSSLVASAAWAGEFHPPAITLSQGWFTDVPAHTPPSASMQGWRPVALPDIWYDNHREDSFPAWYRFEFEVDQASIEITDLWAIYLPAINTNGEIWLNGEKIGNGGSMTQGNVASNWHRPLFFNINRSQLRDGRNDLFIRFFPKQSRFGYLWPVHIGPDAQLSPPYREKLFVKETLTGISAILLAAFAFYLAVIWWLRRKEALYAWFAAGCLVWSFFVFDMYVQHPFLPERLWDTLVFSSVGWMVIFMSFFFHRFYDIRRPRLEPAMLAFGIVGTIALYFSGDRYFYFFSSFIWDNLLIGFSLYLIWVIVRHSIQHPSTENWLLSLSAAIVVAFGGHDNLTQMGIIDLDHTHFLPYGAPFLVGVLTWMLARRFTRALHEAEKLNRELDDRVKKKHQQLETYYDRLRQFENEKILAQERERIMRDMHDGTGGHLVSALSLIQQDHVEKKLLNETLQQALDDVRLMIDSLDSVDEDLLAVLGMFRSRIEPRLKYSGIGIEWKVRDLPPVPELGPEKVLQLMRILQEIITNIIKHAAADTIAFSTGLCAPELIYIEVCDNGRGFAKDRKEGRGTANMDHRAAAIGARLERKNRPEGGACVRILLPLPKDNDKATGP